MNGPASCDHCGHRIGAVRHIERIGWLAIDAWTSQLILGLARPTMFCKPEHVSAEMSRRRFRR